MKIDYIIEKTYENYEIRDILAKKFKMSRTMIKKLKLYGRVDVNGVHTRVIDPVSSGDRLICEYEDNSFLLNRTPGIPILFENDSYAVIVKPANMVTHPGHGHLDDSLLTHLSDNPLHPVMRLDRETSGLIIIAKDGYAHNTLATCGDIIKRYKALTYGKWDEESGTIDVPIARRPGSVMIRDCVTDGTGRDSVTHYNVLKYFPEKDVSLVEYRLETGRCHQIRVHSLHMGHPLVGDGLYGPNSIDNPSDRFPQSPELDKEVGRVALHAYSLKFTDPFENIEREFESPLPPDIAAVTGTTE